MSTTNTDLQDQIINAMTEHGMSYVVEQIIEALSLKALTGKLTPVESDIVRIAAKYRIGCDDNDTEVEDTMVTIRQNSDSVIKEHDDCFHLVVDGETARLLTQDRVLPWLQEKLAVFYTV